MTSFSGEADGVVGEVVVGWVVGEVVVGLGGGKLKCGGYVKSVCMD